MACDVSPVAIFLIVVCSQCWLFFFWLQSLTMRTVNTKIGVLRHLLPAFVGSHCDRSRQMIRVPTEVIFNQNCIGKVLNFANKNNRCRQQNISDTNIRCNKCRIDFKQQTQLHTTYCCIMLAEEIPPPIQPLVSFILAKSFPLRA